MDQVDLEYVFHEGARYYRALTPYAREFLFGFVESMKHPGWYGFAGDFSLSDVEDFTERRLEAFP